MSRWVKQQYEGALAFLFTLIIAVLPWNVAFKSAGEISNVISFHWWVGELRYTPAVNGLDEWYWVHESIQLQQNSGTYAGLLAGGVGTAVFVIAVLLAAVLFVREDLVEEHLPIRYVSGGLLTIAGGCYLTSTIWMFMNGLNGTYIPAGAVFSILFGAVLLTNRFRMTETAENADPAVPGSD